MTLALLLLGCTGGSGDATGGAPSLTLIAPTDGSTVCGAPLHVEADVENFVLTLAAEDLAPPGSGHMHVYLNGQEEVETDQESVDLPDIVPGEYQVRLDLAYADHSALIPYVGTTVYVTVDNDVCAG